MLFPIFFEEIGCNMIVKRKGNQEILKINCLDGIEYLTFSSLDRIEFLTHLFSTRLGGVSEGIFSAMNLSYTRGDKKEAVDENFKRIARIMKRETKDFVCSDQTHTTNIRKVTEKDCGKGVIYEKDYTDVDGLITNESGIVLATFYADCVPLFIVDMAHKAVGLSHSGWKGTVGKMGACTLKAMKDAYGTDPKDVVVAIGPSICQECYEISEDVAEEFTKAFDSGILSKILYQKNEGKYQLDLWEANYQIFIEAGVDTDHISITDICTCCNPEYLFSHRASQGKRGNLGAFISINED